MTSTPPFFPVGSKVILQNLVKGTQYNGEQGKVTGPLNQSTKQQKVFVASKNKTLSIKPVNMLYVPRDISSLEREEIISEKKSLEKEIEQLVRDNPTPKFSGSPISNEFRNKLQSWAAQRKILAEKRERLELLVEEERIRGVLRELGELYPQVGIWFTCDE